jgi:alpha 1,3-glucosidase
MGERLNTAFISEGNALEFYLLAAQGAPKKLQKKLSELTGYVEMPPIHSLGFHFSKWENMTAHDIVARSHDFDHHNYPVDVLWFDIEYS